MEDLREKEHLVREHNGLDLTKRIIYYVLGVIEVLLAFRLVFKLLGANPHSGFVSFIYSITKVFLAPFYGIFPSTISNEGLIRSILEPATLVGMIVYAVIAWGIAKIIDMGVHN